MLPELMLSGGATRLVRIPTVQQAEAELETARKNGARFIAIGEADYPPMLRRMDNPPPLVAVRGTAAGLRTADSRHRRRTQRVAGRRQDGAYARL